MRFRLAVATASFRLPLRQAVLTAARSGAQGVQFDARTEVTPAEFGETARRQLLHELNEQELHVASLTFPLRRPLHDEEHLDARVAAVRQAMEFTSQLKARVLTLRAGRMPEDDQSADQQRLRDVLRDLAGFGNRVGVTLSLTTSGDAATRLRALIEGIKEGPLGVDFDAAACIMAGQDPAAVLRDLHALVTHGQVRDAIRDLDGSGQEVPVGRGEVVWDEVLALLGETNYGGWLVARRTSGDDPVGDCTRAIAYVRNIVAGQ